MSGSIERGGHSTSNEDHTMHSNRVSKDLVYSKLAEYGANTKSTVEDEKIIYWPKVLKLIEEISDREHTEPEDLVAAISEGLVKANVSEHRWHDNAGFAFFFFGREDLFKEHYETRFPRIPAGATAASPQQIASEIDKVHINPARVARERRTMDKVTGDLFRPED